jgi:hypothetical protein
MNPFPFDLPDPPEPLPALDGLQRLERIGSGSAGVVYKAYQPHLGRYVALKVLRAPAFASAEELRRFRREAEVLANSSHPHIVPIYGHGEMDVGPGVRCPYFTMRLMEGGSLAGQVARLVDDPRAAAEMVATLADAVQHAHERGVLHRDLKPANILLDAEGRPHVADFGLARRGDGGTGGTPTGAVIGTPAYVAPEQARGGKDVTPAADVYGLGAVLYELLTGRPPFRADSPVEVLRQVLQEPLLRPRAVNRKLDLSLEAVCLKCLKKDPARRYPSAQALADDLRRWLSGRPVRARRVRPWDRLVSGVRRRFAVTAVVVLVLGLVAVGVAALLRPPPGEDWDAYVEGLKVAEQRIGAGDRPGAEQALDARPRSRRGWEWHCLKSLCQKEPAAIGKETTNATGVELRKHIGEIAYVESPPGSITVVRSHKSPFPSYMVEVLDEEHQKKWPGHVSYIDGAWEEKLVSMYTGARRQFGEEKIFWNFPRDVSPLHFCDNGGRVIGQQGQAFKVFDSLTGKEITAFSVGDDPSQLLVSPAGCYLAAAWPRPRAHRIEVWDTASGRRVSAMDCDPPVEGIALSPDGQRLALQVGTLPADQAAYVWKVCDSATEVEVARLEGETGLDQCCAFSPDARLFASVRAVGFREPDPARKDQEATLRAEASNYLRCELTVWDAVTGERLYTLRREPGGFSPFLCFTPDSGRLLTGSWTSRGPGQAIPLLPPIEGAARGFTSLLEVRVARTGQELVRFDSGAQPGVHGVGLISQDGSRLVVPGHGATDGAYEYVFTGWDQGLAGARLKGIAAIVTVIVAIAALGWFITRRLASRRRSAPGDPQRSEDRLNPYAAGVGTTPPRDPGI